jgi:hypothetical protein
MRGVRLVGVFVLLSSVVSGQAGDTVSSCGQRVTGSAVLAADLDCSGYATGPAVELTGTLDLASHTILGNPTATAVACDGNCVVRGPGTITGALGGVAGARSVRIENAATIVSNVEEGVVAAGSVDVRDSVVRLNRIGIDAVYGRGVLYRSDVSENRGSGLLANRAAKIVDSTVNGNGSIGVVSFESRITARGSEFRDNTAEGLAAAGNARVTACTIVANGSTGVNVEGRRITLRDSVVTDNGFNGLLALFGDVVASGSTVSRNGRSGILGNHVSVRDSVISDNAGDGAEGIVTRLASSVLTGNALAGASAIDGLLTAMGVTAQGNGNAGLYSDGPFTGTCGLRLIDSSVTNNDNDPGCGITMACADLVSCRAPSVRGDSTCETSYQLGSGIPGDNWDVCALE